MHVPVVSNPLGVMYEAAEKGKLTDDELKRCRHVVSEIQRTKAAADALKTNNYVQFGKLMNQSHNSLR